MSVLERADSNDELIAAREEMAAWYRDAGFDTVRSLCFEAGLRDVARVVLS